MPPAQHSLTVRLSPATTDTALAAALTAAAELWWPGDRRRPRLWTESVPAPAASDAAARRRAAEASRPVASGHRLRAVLLRYADERREGAAAGPDLVLTADGSALDARSLRVVARVLRGDLAPEAVTPLAGPLPLDLRLDEETRRLASALALTVGRYEGASAVRVAVPVPARDRPPYALGALDGYAVFAADLSPGRTVAELLATDPVAPADGEELPPLELVAGDGPAVLPTGPGSLPVPAHQVERVRQKLLTTTPNAPLALLNPLSEAESVEQLPLGTSPKDLEALRIDEAFAAQVAVRPDAPALTAGSTTLSYAELDARAEALADGLYAHGVRPGDLVGLCLPRSTDLVAAMLAVLKVDAVHVPLDPEHPADRRERTARDAGVRLTVEDPVTLTGHPPRPAAPGGEPGSPAYVIHTSGSTGRPKGVVVPHGNVTALVDAVREDFGLSPDDTWTCFHSAAFDFSVWEIWGALLTGGRLVVVDHWTTRSPEDFHALLVREGVSVLSQTPSAFTQLAAADRTAQEAVAARLVVLGGEPLDARPLLDWFDRHPEDRCRLVNMYGITETTVHVTAATVTRREALAGSRSVGRPLPGWSVRVLDAHGRPVPPGAPGEIVVGGAGVALGYLNRPALTAERFVPDPREPAGRRLYRSGDLGRLLPDGTLEHLGRIDDQVKVRGFRIEPGEIRHVLLEDPAVSAAAVTVTGGDAGDAAAVRIDAYVVPAPGAGEDPGPVRERAARLLPPHMVPATVTVLPALPLTANGKLDPARLPSPGTSGDPVTAPAPAAAAHKAGPAAALAAIWCDVLGVEAIGPDDDFWDLGGNSLYAIRIGTLARERGLPGIPLRQLYLTPTLGALSEALAGKKT
ncbi:amino acid adenylation domain-containing protein [Streptomyces sp. MBT67]|uniref:amino acid adenylation domain-containing protein n=1 Tax=unclassified Streptomyces TaxID=2593676 RepID=UPI00190C6050|nr:MULTISPECIES: amino acid adenylation domain-containing protein [unclassified Streptomyces]MBK3532912.1 amino acid adenylation domain-containing protein [Streptomyces sp. MBT72]MBK3538758.1 amino acid adenylation domain-containing protein [Streptomyces sp. MBT67]MBK6031662.1 amino acid adenylation domain-containing protein [Streptomyces sp. MBT59]